MTRINPNTNEQFINTMGALYWQLNDIWPGASWTSTEFGGKNVPLLEVFLEAPIIDFWIIKIQYKHFY